MEIEEHMTVEIFKDMPDEKLVRAINGLIRLLKSRGTVIIDDNDSNFRLVGIYSILGCGSDDYYFETEDNE